VPFENVWQEVKEADVVISSINAAEPFISKESLQKINILNYKFLVDLSVPRSIEKTVEEIPGILLYNIDQIHGKASAALEKRMASIPKVKAIIEQAIAEFNDWSKEMLVSPTINKLKNALEQIRQEEITRYLKSMNEEEAKKVEMITKNIMQKIIKLPVLQLKAACKRGEAETLIDVLNDLFDLESQSNKVQ
jgi:glutamyl-tRNA reductase